MGDNVAFSGPMNKNSNRYVYLTTPKIYHEFVIFPDHFILKGIGWDKANNYIHVYRAISLLTRIPYI